MSAVSARTVERWVARTQAERASAQTMNLLAERVEELAPGHAGVVAALRRLAQDETRHGEMCEAVVRRLGSDVPVDAPIPGLPPASAEHPVAALVEHVVFMLCAAEAIAAAMLQVAASLATAPGIPRLLRDIARDESRHAQLGWTVLDVLLDALPAAERESTAHRASRQALRAVMAAKSVGSSGDEGAAWGLLDGAHALEVAVEALRTQVVPELVARDLWRQ